MGSYDQSRRQGTIRYMSPEVLNETLPVEYFDAYKASDVYGFALVMWEIINTTIIDGKSTSVFINPQGISIFAS